MERGPFREVHHVCIVVADMAKAVAFYESVGIGPWSDLTALSAVESMRGVDRDATLSMTYKFANLANIQIQLCQPSEVDTPQRRFLQTRGEGVFHIGFTVADCDRAEREATALGLPLLFAGRFPGGGGFSYFDTLESGVGVNLQVRAVKPPG